MCEEAIPQPKPKDPEKIFNKSSRKGLAGLQNIGNTCFMNSGLQCLSNAFILTKYFLTGEYIYEINEKNVLGTGGRLARSYANLLEEIWVEDKNYASTWEIKKIIAKLAPQVIYLIFCSKIYLKKFTKVLWISSARLARIFKLFA